MAKVNRKFLNGKSLLCAVLFVLALCCQMWAQTFDEDSNWYKEIGRYDDYYSRFDFTKYSKEDVAKAKTNYLRISGEPQVDEWEGSYTHGTMLGRSEIIWNRNDGFVYHYVYHTLAGLSFGRAVYDHMSVRFIAQRPHPRLVKWFFEIEYVKVKWGDAHLLVPKRKLADFARYAVGLEALDTGSSSVVEDVYFWTKIEDENKETSEVLATPISTVDLFDSQSLQRSRVSEAYEQGERRSSRPT